MSLQEEIIRIKAEIAEKEKAEQDEKPEVELEEDEKSQEEVEEDSTKDENPEPEPEKKDPEPVPAKADEKPQDDAGYARLRREAAAERKRADELQRKLEEKERAQPIIESDESSSQEFTMTPEVKAVIEDHQIRQAEREFLMFENKIKQQDTEYGAVAAEYTSSLFQAFKIQNSRKSDLEIGEMTKRAMLIKASEYAKAGYENPVEQIYNEAKDLGFTGKSLQKQDTGKEEPTPKIEPDLKKVAANRQRSAGMAASSGRSEGLLTLRAAADLTTAEWSKLPIAEKKRLMYGQ